MRVIEYHDPIVQLATWLPVVAKCHCYRVMWGATLRGSALLLLLCLAVKMVAVVVIVAHRYS